MGSRGVTGVGRELRFNCWMTMDPGTTEAFGALFHRGARLGHPGSWSQDRLGTDGGVLLLARIGRFVALWVKKPIAYGVHRPLRRQFMSHDYNLCRMTIIYHNPKLVHKTPPRLHLLGLTIGSSRVVPVG